MAGGRQVLFQFSAIIFVASFEPSIDYVVTRILRFAFEVLAHGHHSAGRPALKEIVDFEEELAARTA
jgi:hypothetical protein